MKRLKKILIVVVRPRSGRLAHGQFADALWTAKPPPLPADVSIMQAQIEQRDGKTWLGQSWVSKREGLMVIRLKGSSFDQGYASGKLLQEQMVTLERRIPRDDSWLRASGMEAQGFERLRLLPQPPAQQHVSDDFRSQIHGIVLGCKDPHPELGDYYNRMLNYHAAHDISYMMIDNPLVSKAGCTAFGAWGGATENGHLITGRNFDWEAAEVFSRERIVIMCEPDQGIPFISVAWASMAGVVSGMNRSGVSVTINGAPSSLPGKTATPVATVARDVLQNATTSRKPSISSARAASSSPRSGSSAARRTANSSLWKKLPKP
jgi:isopenicillin-N N-acyltransferase-like protein